MEKNVFKQQIKENDVEVEERAAKPEMAIPLTVDSWNLSQDFVEKKYKLYLENVVKGSFLPQTTEVEILTLNINQYNAIAKSILNEEKWTVISSKGIIRTDHIKRVIEVTENV